MPKTVLTPAIREQIARLGRADIMVGIPSFKNAATIGYVVRAAQAGLVQYFPDLHPVLVNSDAGSPDGTGRVVVETEPPDYIEQILLVRPTNRLQRVSLTYPEIDGVGGKGAALRTIFEIAAALEVQALVVVDSDLRSIVPEWIELLAGPILKGGYDFVAPLYARYKYDGTITNTVTYPLTRALYGHRIRQPIGGDFGVSGDLVRHYLSLDDWTDGRQQVRHRHLDDDVGADRRVRGLPDPAGRQDPRPQGPRIRPRADVPPGRRDDPATRQQVSRAVAADPRQPRRPGLRLRADHRPAAARGEHAAPAVGVPRRLADPRGHVATMFAPATADTVLELAAEAGRLGDAARSRLGMGGDVASTTATTLEMADAVAAFHFPDDIWARVIYDLVVAARDPQAVARDARRRARPDLLRPGGELHHREPARDDRPGRGARRAPGARVRAAQAVSRRALERGAEA